MRNQYQNSDKIHLRGLDRNQLEAFVIDRGWKPFRARQIFHWMYQKNVSRFDEMTTLNKLIRKELPNIAELRTVKPVSVLASQIEPTKKFLFVLPDGEMIESVYMEDADRRTICVSTQVGCTLNCYFCATARMGFRRNLTPGEIVDQVLEIERSVSKKATNIVMMGMGEPFHNYDHVIQAAQLMSHPEGMAISKRKITISTSGIVEGIQRFTQEKQRFKLAISLNATNDDIRQRLMPIAKKYPLQDLMAAVKDYSKQSPYRVTFEYLMIAGLNDSLKDAKQLRRILADIPCKINLIPYNPVDSNYQPPSEEMVQKFVKELETFPAPVIVRKSKGEDIKAACGQLYTEIQNQREVVEEPIP